MVEVGNSHTPMLVAAYTFDPTTTKSKNCCGRSSHCRPSWNELELDALSSHSIAPLLVPM